jgi:hypothetical protein
MKMVLKSQIVYLSLLYENTISHLIKYHNKIDGYRNDCIFKIYIS